MSKTVVTMLGIIILFLIALSYFGSINFKELKNKVDSTATDITKAQKNINDVIRSVDIVKSSMIDAKMKIDSANLDLTKINKKLRQEFSRIQTDIANLEQKREMLDKQIEKLKSFIPGEVKELKKPDYEKLGDIK